MIPKGMLVYLIYAICLAVFAFWQLPTDQTFMMNNFLVSWELLSEGRWWTLVTSVFSHNSALHLLINMLVLSSFGPILIKVIGARRFISFYLLAGITASLSHAILSNYLMHQPELPALGASGSIAGLVLLFSLMFPKEKLLLFGIIPVPALLGAFAFIGIDLWGLSVQAHGGGLPIGHGAHLGGSFTGVVFYFFVIRKRWLTS